ncbi:molybdopterin-binding protein [Methylonatrum kenyense]|uniref:competence/damage-inducible protein A n=1 Tax=Methylonatrum kenyense TaxID=455253 RepID=UPI0020BDBAEF|nr:molybdopterin-binding protein [Methylonatrum kenyense]MCK8515111.1 molybdopterin-binding protein [Methylonatrum kenyense]
MPGSCQPTGFGLIIIGDELLSGKRQDRHLSEVIRLLDERGLELTWARMEGDDPERITAALRETMAGKDVVFSCGGIGGTPDDRTRQCAAVAAGVELAIHPDGRRQLEEQFGAEGASQRLRMVEFPEAAELIPNPVNRVPGFTLGRHHFVPGFPNMAWPMIAWVLDSCYPHLHAVGQRIERSIVVHGARESQLTPLLEEFTDRYPDLRLSCLPRWTPPEFELELGLRGPCEQVEPVMRELQGAVSGMGFHWQPRC